MNLTFHQQLFIFFSTMGSLQSIIFGGYLWSIQRANRRVNLWLTLLIVAVMFRMTKWIGRSIEDRYWGEMYEKLGFTMYLLVGPLLYFYFRAFLGKHSPLSSRQWLHFLPFLLLLIVSYWLPITFWGKPYSRWFFLHLLAYIVLSFRLIRPIWNTTTPERYWAFTLWSGVSLFFVLSVMYMAFFAISYVGLAVGFVVIVYATTFVGFKYKTVFAMVKKNKVTQNTERQVHLVHLERLMQQEKIFTDTLLTLPKVADKMHIPPYLLSQLVNDEYNKSFSEYVNLYRIENAKQLLKADTQQKLKIAAVAFEAGFNTLSAFNTAFKKYVHQTPSEYRKTLAESQKK